jgi:hypothetical protein
MSDETWLWIELAAIVVASCFTAFFAMRGLNKALPNVSSIAKVIAAGILPSLSIVLILIVWDYVDYQEYLKGPQEGRMGPLLFLIYGFPYFILNLLCNLYAAGYAHRQKK